MKTFVFVNDKSGKVYFRKCRVYEGTMNIIEIKKHVLPDEELINFEYAHTCTF